MQTMSREYWHKRRASSAVNSNVREVIFSVGASAELTELVLSTGLGAELGTELETCAGAELSVGAGMILRPNEWAVNAAEAPPILDEQELGSSFLLSATKRSVVSTGATQQPFHRCRV